MIFIHKVGYFNPRKRSQSHRQGDLGEMSPRMRVFRAWANKEGRRLPHIKPAGDSRGSGGVSEFQPWLCSPTTESPAVGQAVREGACPGRHPHHLFSVHSHMGIHVLVGSRTLDAHITGRDQGPFRGGRRWEEIPEPPAAFSPILTYDLCPGVH